MEIDLKQINDLIAVISGTDIIELTIESGGEKITLKKPHASSQAITEVLPVGNAALKSSSPMSFAPQAEKSKESSAKTSDNHQDLIAVTSPMVGTFYRSPTPTSKAFVDVGDLITVGQTVCIIEAMKLMNDMPTEIAGRIVKICVENGTTVEYGQQLFLVDPKG